MGAGIPLHIPGVLDTRQEHLNRVGHHGELDELARLAALVHGGGWICASARLATRDKVLGKNAAGYLGEGKGIDAAAHVTAGIAVGEAADENLIESGAGDHAKLS